MTDYQQQYALWDEFLRVWPPERLATMTLDEYTLAGSKDCFIYWIEFGLSELGSIAGGAAFKFGVFSRKNTETKESGRGLAYSDTHGWYTSLGKSPEEAFGRVREYVVRVAGLATSGDLEGIEAFEHLGEAYKWKIAFHYQNRQAPTIVDVFNRTMLLAFLGEAVDLGSTMATLQREVTRRRPVDLGILEYGKRIWTEWEAKNLPIWKLSHGKGSFDDQQRQDYMDQQLAVMHRKTGKNQGQHFIDAPVGTAFFLCHGNSPQLIGQFTSTVERCPTRDEGWVQRHYRELKPAIRSDPYQNSSKMWSPRGNSTFWRVGSDDLPGFERTLLKPYFGIGLAELASLMDEPIEAVNVDTPSMVSEQVAPSINRIYYGPPGTGKTYALTRLLVQDYPERHSFVTFHQSYGYEEFVEGLRPVLERDAASGQIRYEIRPGVFKALCRRARQAPEQRFAMVIDEINRGNISKIFGELITLIEADKREGAENAIAVTLPYSGESFSVPANVDLIGTMNTADRSLALVDTALRRRFEFEARMPDSRDEPGAPLYDLRVSVAGDTIHVPAMLTAINQRIEALYDRDHTIGHAYFTALHAIDDGEPRFQALEQIFRGRILPLLEEYFFEDWQKIRLVLADNQKPDTACFVAETDHEDELASLFGADHGLDSFMTRRRYILHEAAFSNPDAYIGIYRRSMP